MGTVLWVSHDMKYATNKADKNSCSLKCYYSTDYCKTNHVKHISYFALSDKMYNMTINTLASTGKYKEANVYVLVVGFPIIIYLLFVYSVGLQFIINRHHA